MPSGARLIVTANNSATANPASVPAQTQSLAHTGSDLVVPLGAGLVLVVVGGALAAAGRRREV